MSMTRRSTDGTNRMLLIALAGVLAVVLPLAGCQFLLAGTTGNDNANDNTADNTNDNADNANDNTTGRFAVFTNAATGFSTSDVRDVDEEIVRFDVETKAIVWAEDGASFQEGSWEVDGVFLAGGGFQVRFGTKDGEQRAYFTETGNGFICQIEPIGALISISGTNVPVPQE